MSNLYLLILMGAVFVCGALLGRMSTLPTETVRTLTFVPKQPLSAQPQEQQPDPRTHYLEELIYKYGSDKGKDDHGYTDYYQTIFGPIRHRISNVTEIGVAAGQSLQAWYHYFPNARIHGYDVSTKESVRKIASQLGDRLSFSQLDLLELDNTDLEHQAGLIDESMDIVIEDALHAQWQQEAFLKKLFRLVKPGGYYIIEDINTNDPKGHKWLEQFDLLEEEVRQILHENDAVFVDAHIGHRDWQQWLQRSGTLWAKDHVSHNSHLLVIHKRVAPAPPIKMNFGSVAMDSNMLVLDEDGTHIKQH